MDIIKFLYKTVMFLTLLLFCIGSVCAVDNSTNNINDYNTIRASVDRLEANDVTQTNMINELNTTVSNQAIKIIELNTVVNDLKEDNKALREDNKALREDNKALNSKLDNQSVTINNLKSDNKALKDNNTQLDKRVKALENSSAEKDIRINELNNKLDLQLIEIKQLQANKDKLNAEKCTIYEKLLSSPKKEDFDQLKKDITNKDKEIQKLTVKINKLNSLLSVSGNDVVNSLKHLSSNIKNIKCGQYTFSLDEYLKIPLIKDGKDRVLKYKKTHGRLPNYVTIAGYDVPKNVYKKLFKIK